MHIPEEASSSVQDALLAVCLFAAFADGDKSEAEREEVRKAAEELGAENLTAISRKILMRKVTLQEVVAELKEPQDRLLAYEMALAVCEAGGSVCESEKEFLAELKSLLALPADEAHVVEKQVDEVALVPVNVGIVPPPLPERPDNDGMILRYAILNGALELLPETLATMAIIPMQMKMVYRIGKAHGVELDSSHIKEFLATVGVGLGSQVVEGFARKLMKGLGKKFGGNLGGKVADQATGSAFSFATTYALGKVAEKYYASGRKLDVAGIKSLFVPLRAQAEQLHPQYLPDIRSKASELTPGKIFSLVRGGEV